MTATKMPTDTSIISFEDIKELFREVARQSQETDKQIKETDRQLREQLKETDMQIKETDRQLREMFKKTDKKISELGDRIGELIESMVEGGIVKQFNELNYSFNFQQYSRHVEFCNNQLHIAGEIDFLLENGDTVLLVEVKTNLSISDVKDHLKRLEHYRCYLDAGNKKYKILGAAAGGVIPQNVRDYVLKQGLFLIAQSGESFKIVTPPDGVELKTW
ncbi:MAG: PD-(D/E)XK nuclease family protein [Planctomycetaceae bacterium]|nr:PD-(D/E)XK nuclease family protein [Planctomycetaceae bacterium]